MADQTELVKVTCQEGVATLCMDAPERMNAFSRAMRNALVAALQRVNDDADVRAIVVGAAGAHFSVGGDLRDFPEQTLAECRTRLKRGSGVLMREIVAGPKPVLVAVEGNAYGAGLALAASADHVVAARGARFCCAFTRVAFMPDLALMFTLPRRVGAARAKRMIALAEVLEAAQALEYGLVDDVVDDGCALSAAQAMALRFAQAPPIAFELVKSVFSHGLDEAIRAEVDLQPMAWMSKDHAEGKKAFFEKRRPVFTGR